LPGAANAIHALLPLVPYESQAAVEDRRKQTQLPRVQVGHRQRILELLRVVQRTYQA